MSTLNGFSVSVPEAQEETSDGYVVLRHGQNFRIRMHNGHKENNTGKPADCDVYLQGKHVGTYRVPYGQTVILEHPINDFGKFTAYKNGTPEAYQAEINADDPDNGLIKVVWKPGTKKCNVINIFPNYYHDHSYDYYNGNNAYPIDYEPLRFYCTNNTYDNSASFRTTKACTKSIGCGFSGAGIGLSGQSNQEFKETESLIYDECETTIYLRISVRDNEPRPIMQSRPVYTTTVPRPLK